MSLFLHDDELDDGCYKVRLLLSMLRLGHEKVPVNVHPRREHLSAAALRLNPRGGLPILIDGDHVLADAGAILGYLAKAYDPAGVWWPTEPKAFGEVLGWLGFATADLAPASLARRHDMLEVEADGPAAVAAARRAFRIMDDHMILREFEDCTWFVGRMATVADLALFPAIALSRDFGVDHDEYPALRRWMRRLGTMPGFITMPGIPDFR